MAAAVEFAQKGFEAASFNQIIEAAEISKGAAYYYFDDKSDLYTTVIQHAFSKLAEFFGDFSMEQLTRDNFWDAMEEYSNVSMRRAQEHPKLIALVRSVWAYATSHPNAPGGAIVFVAARNWTKKFVLRGQEVGVIRDDLPMDLMVELIMGLGGATDSWMLGHVDQLADEEIRRYSRVFTDIYRRVCESYEEDDE